jgi:hypothetical protein
MALFLLLLLVAVVLGLVGWIVKGLIWLFIIGCVVFLLSLVLAGFRGGWRSRRVAR